MIGKTLGNFECTALLGRGGMGEVYQAKDRKLGRDVAIKVLPEEFARDKDRVARFQREAKLLASLNHPNIAAIYGLEESDGTHFLVLELIEGETLAGQIKKGPIPVEKALKLALQIAEALEAAHEKGVIHRDLKPANIKVTPDGKVKVLDFGLAKAYAGDPEEVDLSHSPTLSLAATQQGVILGTAAYMSPEQAKGKPVDKGTDIWAFGCVLYEMLTGRQIWIGDTVTDIIAAAVAKDPDFSILPANIHPGIPILLNQCLQKEPRDRFRDAGDVRIQIKQVLADPGGLLVQAAATAKPKRMMRLGLPWVAAIAVLCIAIAGAAGWYFRPSEPQPVMRFYHELPEGQQFVNLDGKVLEVSPDGKQFVYSTTEGLYLRSIGELEARLIAGTAKENPSFPFFSPDGKWIGYGSADGRLKKIAIGGGAPVTVCDVGGLFAGGSWGADNTIVFCQVPGDIMHVSADGGTPESLFKAEGVIISSTPQLMPDGKSVLFTKVNIQQNPIASQIVVQSIGMEKPRELFAGYCARYLPTGHIVYTVGDNFLDIAGHNLFAVPFDPGKLEATGGQVSLVEGIRGPYGVHYAVSDSGTLVYMPSPGGAGAGTSSSGSRTLAWVDRKGNEEPLSAQPDNYGIFRISPDGTRVALTVTAGGNADIWIWDVKRETRTRLTFDAAENNYPLWTPDGQRIAFRSAQEGLFGGIYWKAADGTGEIEKLGSLPDRAMMPWAWSGDGKTMVLLEWSLTPPQADIGMLAMEGERARTPLLQEKHNEATPLISPNGRWMAYVSDESGKEQIYVRAFPDVNKGKWQVSTNGGTYPLWSPDGNELFYREGDDAMAVRVETESVFNAGKPAILFRGTYAGPWDISPDGKRFLMIKPGESAADGSPAEIPRKIIVVLNWLNELKDRVPVE